MFHAGDLVETREGQTLLKPGLYKVLTIGLGSAQLSHLRTEREDDLEEQLNRITFVPATVLEIFQLVRLATD